MRSVIQVVDLLSDESLESFIEGDILGWFLHKIVWN